ncbi:NAD(P) transhydrogenase subunit alpha [Legionella nautarum]|uniref:proton-translocating NAD(P)(+) transhydrogenase n=1 Tax=Legionella nautarum TaxID=45070 RepID=A0A0W0X229_9GAMM|nr:hypothetical protein [Legionella nautarum]KTD38580.1 NAD(P) transhydrogenase subunit alpha [Legionella nautarum]
MQFKQILVTKETRENEKRVALTPQAVAQLTQHGYRILVEEDAGLKSGFPSSEYVAAGAEIFIFDSSGIPASTFIVRVLRPSKERELIENKLLHKNTAMLGFLFPFVADNHISSWQELGLTTLSLDLFKSISIYDPKNAQAAMSRIAGRLAFHDALKHYKGNKPTRLTVIGAGAAGISAALEAVKHHVPVQLFGRKESQRLEFEAKGITYYVLPEAEKQVDFIKSFLTEETLVITAARTPGKKAPLLLDESSLRRLPPHTVVVDLAISNGCNVLGAKHDQIIRLENDVLLVNVSGYPKAEPRNSSEAYSQCVVSLLTEIMSPRGDVSFENKWVQELWVTHEGQRHDALYDDFDEAKTCRAKL